MHETTKLIIKADKGLDELLELLKKCNLPFDAQHDLVHKICSIRDDLYMAKKAVGD